MKKNSLVFAVAMLAIPFAADAQNQPQAAVVVEKAPGAASVTETIEVQGKIKSVNKKSRSVVVVGPSGNEIPMTLGDEVRNFNQIKVGDLVTLTMMHALALELRKVANDGIRERVDSENVKTAKPGEKPGVVVEKSVRVIANVVAVNPKAQTVTLRGPKRTLELALKDANTLQNVKVGDQVEAVYVEAVALSVSPAPKK
jgi:Cu/Ag efflux protein CusF